MGRLSREQINKIKKQYGVDTLYSFSRYNAYLTDRYSYYLNYVKHVPPRESDSIYSRSGSMIHEILQDYLEGKIAYEDISEI